MLHDLDRNSIYDTTGVFYLGASGLHYFKRILVWKLFGSWNYLPVSRTNLSENLIPV